MDDSEENFDSKTYRLHGFSNAETIHEVLRVKMKLAEMKNWMNLVNFDQNVFKMNKNAIASGTIRPAAMND